MPMTSDLMDACGIEPQVIIVQKLNFTAKLHTHNRRAVASTLHIHYTDTIVSPSNEGALPRISVIFSATASSTTVWNTKQRACATNSFVLNTLASVAEAGIFSGQQPTS